MKTRRQWFDSLPEPYRKQCHENLPANRRNEDYEFPDLYACLSSSFVFSQTPQGHDYWKNIIHNYNIKHKTHMRTFQANDTIFCVNDDMQESLYKYAISKGVPVFPNAIFPINGRKEYYIDWKNIAFSRKVLSGNNMDKNAPTQNWITVEQFIEYCDSWKQLQVKIMPLSDNYDITIDYNDKIILAGCQTITFEKVKEIYNECFK